MSRLAEQKLKVLLKRAQVIPSLKRMGPKAKLWSVDIKFVGADIMIWLNEAYRGKRYATDVLSFSAPPIFVQKGHLGELVLCFSVLQRQARERGHRPEVELEVLLVHGVLHLLGMDHERGGKQAQNMAKLEKKLLQQDLSGLIARNS
jgi:probable rRNA maturation factor